MQALSSVEGGTAGGDRYVTGNPYLAGENVVLRMRPERWLSQDQGTGSTCRLVPAGLTSECRLLPSIDEIEGSAAMVASVAGRSRAYPDSPRATERPVMSTVGVEPKLEDDTIGL